MTTMRIGLIALALAGALRAGDQQAPRPLSAEDVYTLLVVGVPEAEILRVGDRDGWPERLDHARMERILDAGAGPRLRERLLLRLGAQRDRRARLEGWRAAGFDHDARARVALLVPKELAARPLAQGRGLQLDEFEKGEALRGRSFFAATHSGAAWRADNDRALARLAFEAACDGLRSRTVVTGVAVEHTLFDPSGGGSYAMVDGLVEDLDSGRKALLAVAVRVLDDHGVVLVCGGLVPVVPGAEDPLVELAILIGSAEIVPRAL